MKIEIHLLRFYVLVWDPEKEKSREEPITLTKDQLRAAGLIGLSSKEIINRMCERRGLQVLEIGKAERRTVAFNLDALWDNCCEQGAPIDPLEHSGGGAD